MKGLENMKICKICEHEFNEYFIVDDICKWCSRDIQIEMKILKPKEVKNGTKSNKPKKK